MQTETDWNDESPHPLSIIRYYRSFGNIDVGMGGGWSHGFSGVMDYKAETSERVIRLGDGTKSVFISRVAGQWESVSGDTLVLSSEGWIYQKVDDDVRWQFRLDGKLEKIISRNGWFYIVSYDGFGRIVNITNAFNRKLQFSYSLNGRLSSIGLPMNYGTVYYFVDNNKLISVSDSYANISRYSYENTSLPFVLTSRYDANNQRIGSYSYDWAGRAISTVRSEVFDRYTVYYGGGSSVETFGSLVAANINDLNWYKSSATILTPHGAVETYNYQGGNGVVRLASSNTAFNGNLVANRIIAAGTNLPTQETDFQNNKTTYDWDSSRRLLVARTDAIGTAQQRATIIEWHPHWRLPTKVTEPGRSIGYM